MATHPDSRAARRKKVRIALALSLIVVLTMWISGCIYLPIFDKARSSDGVAPSEQLGPADSHKPLRITVATRRQVIAIFGTPDITSDDGHAIGYTQLSAPTWVCFGICNGVQRSDYYLFLDFDDQNILHRYSIVTGFSHQEELGAPAMPAPEGVDVQTAWLEFRKQNPHPSTAPAAHP